MCVCVCACVFVCGCLLANSLVLLCCCRVGLLVGLCVALRVGCWFTSFRLFVCPCLVVCLSCLFASLFGLICDCCVDCVFVCLVWLGLF